MKRRFTILTAALALLTFLAVPMGTRGQTTYSLQKVTSVEVGGLYVFEQAGHVMNNTVSSSALQTTNSYLTVGLTGTESYVWTLEAATNGFYMKNVSLSNNQYLNNASSTNVSFGSKSSIWGFTFQSDETVLIQNKSNSSRFLGYTNSTSYAYKAYAQGNLSSYPHAVVVYKLVADSGNTSDLALINAPVELTFDLYNNSSNQVIEYTTSSSGSVSVIENDYITAVVNQTNKTITVTPVAVTNGAQTITVNQVADQNYNAGTVSFTVTITDSTPFAGGVVTFVAGTDIGTSTGQNPDEMTKSGVTVSGTSAALASSEYRLYSGSTTTISTTAGTITEIVFTGNSTSYPVNRLSVDNGNGTYTTNNNIGTWTGDATSVSFSAGGQARVSQIDVTVTVSSGVATTTTINVPSDFNTDIYTSTNAGTLSATVSAGGTAISGATVTWSSSDTGVATIDAYGVVTLVAVGTTTITANYAGVTDQYRPSSATYDLTVIDSYAPGSQNNPYNVAQAISAIDNNGNVTGVYVTGIVSEVTYYSENNHYITYYISADGLTTGSQLEVFHGKGINGADFSSIEDIQVGDVVMVYGDLTIYNSSTYEFTEGNRLVSLVRQTITVTPNVVNVDATPDGVDYIEGTLDITLANLEVSDMTDFGIQYYDAQGEEISTPAWIEVLVAEQDPNEGEGYVVSYTIEENEGVARTAYFKVFAIGNVDFVYSNLVTINQAAPITQEYYQYSVNGVEGNLVEVSSGTQITLRSTVDNVPTGYTFVGWTTVDNNFSNILAPGSTYTITTTVEFFAVYSKQSVVTTSMTIDADTENFPDAYGTANTFREYTLNGKKFMIQQVYINGEKLQFRAAGNNNGTGTIYNNEDFGAITSIVLNYNSSDNNKNFTIKAGSSANPTDGTEITPTINTTNDSEYTFDMSSGNYTYFVLTNGTGAGYLDNIIINYSGVTTSYYTRVYTLSITAYSGSKDHYYLIASPVEEDITPSVDNGFITTDYDLYMFDQTGDEDGNEWINFESNTFDLVNGLGYLYASSCATTLTFTGTPVVGPTSVSLVLDDEAEFPGWNLVGNPFAGPATIGSRDYYTINDETNELMQNSGVIPAMNGVFVIAEEDGEELTFTAAVSGAGTSQADGNKLVLNLTKGRGLIDRAVVRFGEGRTLPKFMLNADNTKLYITEGNQDYAVVRSNNAGEMPVSFKAAENGNYTLSIEAENVEASYLHLIDNMTGADVDLLATPSYSFEARTTDYANRFRLEFNTNSVEENNATANFAYFNGSSWTVNNMGEATLQVVDMMGRVISTETISGNTEINLNQAAGVYMLRLVTGNDVKVQKVVVR